MINRVREVAGNRLIAGLPGLDRRLLLADCTPVELAVDEVLAVQRQKIRQVYFPIDAAISLSVSLDLHAGFEVRLIGPEGMLGIGLLLGTDRAPSHARVQSAGAALRISTAAFLRLLDLSAPLHLALRHYLLVVLSQLGQAATCNRFHLVESRLARWLLMAQDRTLSNELYVTHEALASLLGVRRVGVTKAASSLQDLQLISYRRGHVTILDRTGLQSAACICYLTDKSTYSNLMRKVSGFGIPPKSNRQGEQV